MKKSSDGPFDPHETGGGQPAAATKDRGQGGDPDADDSIRKAADVSSDDSMAPVTEGLTFLDMLLAQRQAEVLPREPGKHSTADVLAKVIVVAQEIKNMN